MEDKALLAILKCAEKADGQVGRSGMLKILLGKDSKKLSKLKLDHLEEHGALSFMGKTAVLEHIDHLIDKGCLSVGSAFSFPMLNVTDIGRDRVKQIIRTHGLRVLPEPLSTTKQKRKIEKVLLCDEKEFWDIFLQDLKRAKYEVIIFSPFMSMRRVRTLLKDFEELLSSGVEIKVYARPVQDYQSKAAILDALEGLGVQLAFRKRIHHKVAIIDRDIAWEGSLNILQHWDTGEQMTRHEDPEYVNQLLGVLGLG